MGNDEKATIEMHAWSSDALLAKSQRFAEEMLKFPKDDWRFALWSTLVLELLGRAALAKVHPALLAEPKDWNHLLYSLGHSPKANKFVPKSIDVSSVFSRVRDINNEFTTELEGFAILHMNRRNEELHGGSTPLDSLKSSGWLPTYYRACEVLTKSAGSSLSLLLGAEETKVAEQMISAAMDESAKAVKQLVAAHKTIWNEKSSDEREKLSLQSSAWATKQDGHRVKCPACSSDALVSGVAISAPLRNLDNNNVVETQQYLPTKFECVACQLKVSGLSQLSVCGLGDTYKATLTYDLASYYIENDDYAGYEPDNNEP
jgi:hypothetical protein